MIIATDGEASDGEVAKALKPLDRLPVLLILRLCTPRPELYRLRKEGAQDATSRHCNQCRIKRWCQRAMKHKMAKSCIPVAGTTSYCPSDVSHVTEPPE